MLRYGLAIRRGVSKSVATAVARQYIPANGVCIKALANGCRSFASACSGEKLPEFLKPSDTFLRRHIGPEDSDIAEMLKVCKASSLAELIDQTIPPSIRRRDEMDVHEETLSEFHSLNKLKDLAFKNKVYRSYIGMGFYNTILPAVIQRNLLENPGWYTAYTPYQAEISQGRLESLLNFQTMVTELTGMEIAGASLLDESSAAAEAMTMVFRATGGNDHKSMFYVSDRVHPQTIAVIRTRAEPIGLQVVVGDHKTFDFKKDALCGALLQYPDTLGVAEDLSAIAEALHSTGAQLVVAADPLALTLLKPPGEFGADVAVGSMQRFGVPLGFGGPHAAYFATKKENMRRMPGRIIGVSIDSAGNRALRMALQTREQHIRKDKATSNICTSQALLANIAAMYGIYHGPEGLKAIAKRVFGLTQALQEGLHDIGFETINGEQFFDTLTVDTSPCSSEDVVRALLEREINVRVTGNSTVSISLDETTTVEDVKDLLGAFTVARGRATGTGPRGCSRSSRPPALPSVSGEVSSSLKRATSFMKQSVFNMIQTETEMMRYMRYLEGKDLALNTSMITLGSCTMKLNPAATLMPVSWPEFANIHPFAPKDQTEGYLSMMHTLKQYLCEVTGFDAVTLQPNSGATGEYAGLLAIREYHKSMGEAHRTVCIIPKSAHGTNPASAVMAGMSIKAIDSDENGNLNMEQLEAAAKEHAANLACLMVTYPSTHGVFEEGIKEAIDMIHKYGGQVYMDGANMNAQVGLTSPAIIGADVCHLNLHKTFAIPHGGGGPGVGPIAVKKHLAPFLPDHPVISTGPEHVGPTIVAAPFGSAMILPIPYMFITMLGREGLVKSTEIAILNANYMMNRLASHYPIKYQGKHGRCAHEFIINVEEFKKSAGVTEEDIAKRLIDYGFHAPTMSWPVPAALMVEPTESENKGELDRFCDAMILIRKEIEKIERKEWPEDDNPLKNAPHTQRAVCSDKWAHPYSREQAAFPAPWVHLRGKFWPSVGRVNNPYGEKNLVCSCGDVSDYSS